MLPPCFILLEGSQSCIVHATGQDEITFSHFPFFPGPRRMCWGTGWKWGGHWAVVRITAAHSTSLLFNTHLLGSVPRGTRGLRCRVSGVCPPRALGRCPRAGAGMLGSSLTLSPLPVAFRIKEGIKSTYRVPGKLMVSSDGRFP